MFGSIGGVLGYYFASRVEKLAEATVVYDEDQTRNQGQRNSFLISLLVLSASVSRQTARNFGSQAGGEAEDIVRELLTTDYNLYEVCGQIRSCMDYSQRLQLYHYLVALGACDGLHQREIEPSATDEELISINPYTAVLLLIVIFCQEEIAKIFA